MSRTWPVNFHAITLMEFNINFPGSSIIDEAIKLKCFFIFPFSPLTTVLPFSAASAFNSSKVVLYLRFGYKFVCFANKYIETLGPGSTKAPLTVDTWPGVVWAGQGLGGRGMAVRVTNPSDWPRASELSYTCRSQALYTLLLLLLPFSTHPPLFNCFFYASDVILHSIEKQVD